MGLILANINGGPPGFFNVKVGNGGGMGVGAAAPIGGAAASTPHSYWRIRDAFHRNDLLVFPEVQFRTTVGGANVATGGTAIASSTHGSVNPANAFDGNINTIWFPNFVYGVGSWIGYQFASPVDIKQIAITSRGDSAGLALDQTPQWGYIEYSDNGTSWTIQDIFATPKWLQGQTRTFTLKDSWNTRKQAFRIQLSGAPDSYITAREIELRSSVGGTNVSLYAGATSTSETSSATKAVRAFDGDINSHYVSSNDADPKSIVVWLGEVTIAQLAYTCDTTARAPTTITLQSSVDAGTNWVTEQTWTGISWTASETKTFNLTNPIVP